MNPVRSVDQVFTAIQNAKSAAKDFRTNFFPVQAKLQAWIDHQELLSEVRGGAAFFLRKDRDFQHLYFCSASLDALGREATAVNAFSSERVVVDLVGSPDSVAAMADPLQAAGFRRYTRLHRLARPGKPEPVESGEGEGVGYAGLPDSPAVLELLESAFDRYGEQLPALYEVESAVQNRQVLTVKRDGQIAGLLFFETQGVASTVRFWVVAEAFRSLRVGSAMLRHYFKSQSAVRRFTLWVNTANENAIGKYRRFGYGPDGLVDQVLANALIRA